MKRQSKLKEKVSSPRNLKEIIHKKIVLPLKKYVFRERFGFIFLLLIFGLLARDIFVLSSQSDVKYFGITILFYIIALFYGWKSRFTFIICLLLLLIMYVKFLQTGPSITTEKTAVWLFLFMVVGMLQQWKE